jgi:hypothetical protein
MTHMVTLFEFGTLWFWLLIIAASFVLFACTEFERGFLATVTILVAVLVLHFAGGEKILKYVVDHPARTFQGAGIYLLLGTFWGVNKWYFYVKRQRRKYDEALDAFRKEFKKEGNLDTYRRATIRSAGISGDYETQVRHDKRTPDEVFKAGWKQIVDKKDYCAIEFEFQPDPKKHKNRILIWMTYWPWSFLWTMLNDPFKAAYHWVLGLLRRISHSAFREVQDPVLEATEKK